MEDVSLKQAKAMLTAERDDWKKRAERVPTNTIKPQPASVTRHCWLSNHFGMPNSKVAGAVTATAAIVHCNTKTDAPYQIDITFDRDFIVGALVLPEAGAYPITDPVKRGTTYSVHVNSPALLSDQTAIVTVYGTTDQYPRAIVATVNALQ